jgi:hypothetical protein
LDWLQVSSFVFKCYETMVEESGMNELAAQPCDNTSLRLCLADFSTGVRNTSICNSTTRHIENGVFVLRMGIGGETMVEMAVQ